MCHAEEGGIFESKCVFLWVRVQVHVLALAYSFVVSVCHTLQRWPLSLTSASFILPR